MFVLLQTPVETLGAQESTYCDWEGQMFVDKGPSNTSY